MKLHHGIDLVSISRIALALARHPERFAARVMNADEVPRPSAKQVAKHWAAKEAFAKACGLGIRAPVTWQSMTLAHDALGKPIMRVNETVGLYLKNRGITSWSLSLSDEQDLVMASVVMLEEELC